MADEIQKKTRRKIGKLVPSGAFCNEHLDLFQDFLANTENAKDQLSNAVNLWDNIPRYSISRKKQKELRLPGGFLPISMIAFRYLSHDMKVHIRPARI
jgi:hypothetical protein